MTRIQGQPGQLAEMVVPVKYQSTASGVRVIIDSNRLTGDLMPSKDPDPAPGRLSKTGQVLVGGNSIGSWKRTSGSNVFSRVIGESKPVPGPQLIPGLPIGNNFGGVYNLTFSPAYYFPDSTGQIGEDGVVQVYGNDFARRYGNRDFNSPNPFGRYREGEYYFVSAEDTDDTYFPNEDQIWVAVSAKRKYRVAFSFAYTNNSRTEQYDLIVQANLDPSAPPSYAQVVGNYWVISLPQIVSLPDIYGNPSQFVQANYQYADPGSVRLQRIYQEIPIAQNFNPNDPYEYKVSGTGSTYFLGTIIFNPAGFNYRVYGSTRGTEVLQARVDYTVFDWRIIKDEFRVPRPELISGSLLPKDLKLSLASIKAIGSQGPDGLYENGLGLVTPVIGGASGFTDDVVVVDLQTGGVLLGNKPNDPNAPSFPQNPNSSWNVEKNSGQITFRDVDNNPANGLSAYICYPTGGGAWTAPQLVGDITDRAIRVLYMGRNEWSVQPFKAARSYRVSGYVSANGLGPGECFVGGTLDQFGSPIGRPYRLYFAPFDLNQKVIVGELWINTGGNPTALYDQEFQITGIENVNGLDLAYADIHDKTPGAAVFDWSQGYSVRRVRGASLKVRVLWNPASFKLENDTAQNYKELEVWMRSWRKTENESLQIGGRN